jgi:hypothetical protein
MDGTRKAGAAVVTEGAAQAVLRRGATRELSPDEEKVMRMRLGASPPPGALLERAGEGLTDVEIEVLAYEIEAFMKLRALREREAERRTRAPAPPPSRTKEKIVRALRKKT